MAIQVYPNDGANTGIFSLIAKRIELSHELLGQRAPYVKSDFDERGYCRRFVRS